MTGVSQPDLLRFTHHIGNTGHMMAAPTFGVRTRRARFIVLSAVFALVLGLISATPTATPPADAATGAVAAGVGDQIKTADLSQFQAGNIMSDAVFFNSGTMSAAQIQSFLEARVPRCDAGYTCLKDWYDTSRTVAADAMCGAYSGGVRERASTIIYKVAQACGINPQVILATLEKEQGLVTHVWPSDWRYERAMGQGCPDTAECDTRYLGFFNQVYGAAWQFKRYANPAGTSQYFTWYAPGQTWNVRYHPDASCGSSPVYIQNQATANLYYYTPYQPNGASLRAGYGEGDGCSSYGNRNFYQRFTDWFGSTQVPANANNPFGNIEVVRAAPGEFEVGGWVIDPDTSAPISVHVYVGAQGTAVGAEIERPDVAAAYPKSGSKHGFSAKVPAIGSGPTDVCIYAINSGPGANVLLGCRTIAGMSGSPFGYLESVTPSATGLAVSGWAIDPDSVSPTAVHVYVDGTGVAVLADGARPDLQPHYPQYGTAHGFSTTVTAGPGAHTVCAYAINIAAGGNVQLGCSEVVVPSSTDLARPPIGNFEALSVTGSTATAAGWAIDPDTTASIPVHIYVGATGGAYTADKDRPDVARAYPASGAAHGFAEQLTLPVGRSEICVYAINTGAGGHTLLGCRTANVVAPASDPGRAPIGNFEGVAAGPGGASVTGWALDPDTADPISIHIYVDQSSAAYTADDGRADVAGAYGLGDRHGFNEFVAMSPGSHQVCVYAINNAAGGHVLLGCRTALVP